MTNGTAPPLSWLSSILVNTKTNTSPPAGEDQHGQLELTSSAFSPAKTQEEGMSHRAGSVGADVAAEPELIMIMLGWPR
jgi:hypothetical protein